MPPRLSARLSVSNRLSIDQASNFTFIKILRTFFNYEMVNLKGRCSFLHIFVRFGQDMNQIAFFLSDENPNHENCRSWEFVWPVFEVGMNLW